MNRPKRPTKAEQKFISTLLEKLPPVIARKEVNRFLGGIVAAQTLSNLDSLGEGPSDTYRVGNNVVYKTDSLVRWLVAHVGVEQIKTSRNSVK